MPRGPFLRRCLVVTLFRLIEPVQEFFEAIGNALPQHVVVNALKDVADPSLILAAQPPSRPSHLRVGMHGGL